MRLVVSNWEITLETFRASTLAMSVGMLAIFVQQSLKSCQQQCPPSDEEEIMSMAGAATNFMLMAIVFFSFFGCIAMLNPIVYEKGKTDLKYILSTLQGLTFAISIVPITYAVVVQKSYKLKAAIK